MDNLLNKSIDTNHSISNDADLYRLSWWMYPNVYSLDAPIVAITWQCFFAKVFNIPITLTTTLVLALVVWGIYLFDHLLDAKSGEYQKERHTFADKNQNLFIVLISIDLIGIAIGCFYLPNIILLTGATLGTLVALYFGFVHIKSKAITPKKNVKELFVGIGFGLGVTLPIISSNLAMLVWMPSMIMFSLLCWLNCRLIEIWESKTERLCLTDLLLIAFLVGGQIFVPVQLSIVISMSLFGFYIISKFSGSANPSCSRVLADLILLTPVFFWLVP